MSNYPWRQILLYYKTKMNSKQAKNIPRLEKLMLDHLERPAARLSPKLEPNPLFVIGEEIWYTAGSSILILREHLEW
jgi:hypothetical protein